MQTNIEKDEINLDFNKLSRIVLHRSPWTIACYLIAIILAVIITYFQQKIYITDATLLINKSEKTNLADINPFIIGDTASAGGGGLSGLLNQGGGGLGNELEILKSPLVMNRVIRENNLIYSAGPKKGKYINGSAFAENKNLVIENVKGSKTIKVSYKSPDPKVAYSIVNSIIKNYKDVYEDINANKAVSDKEFLTHTYLTAKNDLDQKIAKFKDIDNVYASASVPGGLMAIYNKKLNQELNNVVQEGLNIRKVQTELEQAVEKVKMLKTKIEWINLVEGMSKNVTNISILKEPELKESFEYSEPNLNINIIIGILIGVIVSSCLVIGIEITSKKLSYSDMDDNTILAIKDKIDLLNLKVKIITDNIKNLAVVSVANSDKSNRYIEMMKKELANNNVVISLTTENNTFDEHIKNLLSSEYVVLIGQIDYTDRKIFNSIKNTCQETGKNIINTILLV